MLYIVCYVLYVLLHLCLSDAVSEANSWLFIVLRVSLYYSVTVSLQETVFSDSVVKHWSQHLQYFSSRTPHLVQYHILQITKYFRLQASTSVSGWNVYQLLCLFSFSLYNVMLASISQETACPTRWVHFKWNLKVHRRVFFFLNKQNLIRNVNKTGEKTLLHHL